MYYWSAIYSDFGLKRCKGVLAQLKSSTNSSMPWKINAVLPENIIFDVKCKYFPAISSDFGLKIGEGVLAQLTIS